MIVEGGGTGLKYGGGRDEGGREGRLRWIEGVEKQLVAKPGRKGVDETGKDGAGVESWAAAGREGEGKLTGMQRFRERKHSDGVKDEGGLKKKLVKGASRLSLFFWRESSCPRTLGLRYQRGWKGSVALISPLF